MRNETIFYFQPFNISSAFDPSKNARRQGGETKRTIAGLFMNGIDALFSALKPDTTLPDVEDVVKAEADPIIAAKSVTYFIVNVEFWNL
jgi:hypothetical protein